MALYKVEFADAERQHGTSSISRGWIKADEVAMVR